jgi:hypothetical protein
LDSIGAERFVMNAPELQPAGDDAEFGLWSLETMSSDVNPARILAPAALVVQRII